MFGLTEKDADNIATGISSCPQLALISVRNSKVTDTLLYDVMGGIDKLTRVTHLDFPNNALTDECIDVLTKAMMNKKIRILNLSNNKIGNEGAKNLAIFIANKKSSLEDLNLSLNLIEDDGGITLLKVFPCVSILYISVPVAGNIAGEIDQNPQSFLQQTGLPVQ